MTQYNPWVTKHDPEITIKVPTNILRDLVLRAEENGQSVETEFALRLARTLEHDLEMIEEDNKFACKAMEMCRSHPELMDGMYKPFEPEEE